MSKLPVKKEFPWSKIGSWKHANPYTIAFVYPIEGKPFALKGGANDIEEWLAKNMAETSHVVHNTYFCSSRTNPFLGREQLPRHRRFLDVHLVSDDYVATINQNTKRVELGEDPDFGYMRYDWHRDGFAITVYNKDESHWRNRGDDVVMKKTVKRVPRCFPKELIPYCQDYKPMRQKLIADGVIKV